MGLVRDYLVYLTVRIFVCLLQTLPLDSCRRLAGGLATLLTTWAPVRRKVLEENLTHAFPELSAADRRRVCWQMWEHLFLMICEIAHAPRKMHDSNWRSYIVLKNAPMMMKTLFDRRPTVFVAAHYGNFELAGYLMGLFGFATHSVARPLDNRFLDRYVNDFRSARGQHIIAKDGTAQEIDSLLAEGGTLSVLADQHAGNKGCIVEFFGRPASTHKAVAIFSFSNDAPLVVGFARRRHAPLHYEMGAESAVDPRSAPGLLTTVPGLTQWYTHQLEAIIRRAPEQYWWIHRRWKETTPRRRKKPQAA